MAFTSDEPWLINDDCKFKNCINPWGYFHNCLQNDLLEDFLNIFQDHNNKFSFQYLNNPVMKTFLKKAQLKYTNMTYFFNIWIKEYIEFQEFISLKKEKDLDLGLNITKSCEIDLLQQKLFGLCFPNYSSKKGLDEFPSIVEFNHQQYIMIGWLSLVNHCCIDECPRFNYPPNPKITSNYFKKNPKIKSKFDTNNEAIIAVLRDNKDDNIIFRENTELYAKYSPKTPFDPCNCIACKNSKKYSNTELYREELFID